MIPFSGRRKRTKVVQPFGKSQGPGRLLIVLCDINPEMTDAWLRCFASLDDVEILQGDLLDTDTDAIVSPANSFGDMGGGVDKRIDDYFEGAAQRAVVDNIRVRFMGECPVGMAFITQLAIPRPVFLVATPTMRIPGSVAGSHNAYLAMRAALVAVIKYNERATDKIGTIAIPGLCTGIGGMTYQESALQMRAAYDNIILGQWKKVVHPAMAPFPF